MATETVIPSQATDYIKKVRGGPNAALLDYLVTEGASGSLVGQGTVVIDFDGTILSGGDILRAVVALGKPLQVSVKRRDAPVSGKPSRS